MPMTLNSLFFSALDFKLNIAHLKTTIDNVSAWMSANLLSLNESKTALLLIGLPQQLNKVSDPTLAMPSNVTITPKNSARNHGVIFDYHSLSQNISHPCLNHAFYPFATFVESGTLSTIPLLKPSLYVSHSFQGRLL